MIVWFGKINYVEKVQNAFQLVPPFILFEIIQALVRMFDGRSAIDHVYSILSFVVSFSSS